jgi:hypothetical protein
MPSLDGERGYAPVEAEGTRLMRQASQGTDHAGPDKHLQHRGAARKASEHTAPTGWRDRRMR